MADNVVLEMVATAEADVVRGCCGKSHEYSPVCPFANKSEEDN